MSTVNQSRGVQDANLLNDGSRVQRNGRILVIDDQEDIHDDYRKIIGAKRTNADAELDAFAADLFDVMETTPLDPIFEIDSAFQGEDGYRLVQESLDQGKPYAMAFVDIRMPPGWDGIETVQRIWDIDPEILIVLCSAYSDYSWEAMVEKLGRNDRFLVLKKPFDNIEVRQFAIALTERWNLARTDVLTGALNRRAMQEQMQREWARSVRHQVALTCVMLDLDFFKKINDTEGHPAGDAVLKWVATLLQQSCRANDLVFRFGGEEFCVVLPHVTENDAALWAERTRQAIAATPVPWGDRMLHVTASFGVAERLADTRSVEALVDSADEALRVAKSSGRNRVVRQSALYPSQGLALDPAYARSGLFQGVLARDVMSHEVATLRGDTTVGEAARFFLDHGLHSAPILDADGKLVGILSEVDVLDVVNCPQSWQWPISRVGQPDVICYEEQAPVEEIVEFLSRVTMRRVTIVRDERPIGTIGRTDLLRWFSNWVTMQSSLTAGAGQSPAGSPKVRLLQAAQCLAARAERLCDELSSKTTEPPLSNDLYGPLVGNVSAMQDLLRDLLRFSKEAQSDIASTG